MDLSRKIVLQCVELGAELWICLHEVSLPLTT